MNLNEIGDAIPRRGNRLLQKVANWLMSLCGWRIDAEIPNIPKFVLIGAPHTSNWDFILALGTIFSLGIDVSWMGKHSMFRWPLKGLFTWLGGIPVNRTVKNSGLVGQTIEAFNRREKLIVGMMPEATRAKVSEWKTGFYHIAQGASVPVILVSFDYARKVMGVTRTIDLTGNLTLDVERIQQQFGQILGRSPLQA
jgi:1-acyl-sn-glycerol-3-phosphate acyltransferase